ncbi:MAG: YfhO family protein, partial [Phycisphaerae bacterium]
SAIWLPLQLAWIDWMADPRQMRRRTRGLFSGTLLFVQPLLAGFFEIAFYAFIACAWFALLRAGRLLRSERAARPPTVFLAKVAAAPILAALLAAPQLLPFLEVVKLNIRAQQERPGYESLKASALSPVELLTTVSPDALGNPAEHETFDLADRAWRPIRARNGADAYYFGPMNYVEAGYYFGLPALAFLLLGIPARGPGRGFAWSLMALALAFALVTPVYKVFYDLVPGARQVRTPFRWMYLVLFAATCLAAMGGQAWFERIGRPGRWRKGIMTVPVIGSLALFFGVLALLAWPGPLEGWARSWLDADPRAAGTFTTAAEFAGFLWVNGFRFASFALAAAVCLAVGWWRAWSRRGVTAITLAALALLAFDLGQASFSFYPHVDPAMLNRTPDLIAKLQDDPGVFRIGRFGPDKLLYANSSVLYGLQDFGGYDSILLTDYLRFLEAIEHQHLAKFNIVMTLERPGSLDSPLLPLLNIRYLLTHKNLEHPDWAAVPVEGNVKLYRLRAERELPRAYLVGSARPVRDPGEAIAAIKDGTVDVFTAVAVESAEGASPADGDPSEPVGKATIVRYESSSVEVRTDAPAGRWLVLLDVYYPGWNAYIDGEPARVHRANGTFRAVKVPPGAHAVEFRFEPARFRVGAMIAAACLALLAGLGLAGRGAGRSAPPGTSAGPVSAAAALPAGTPGIEAPSQPRGEPAP